MAKDKGEKQAVAPEDVGGNEVVQKIVEAVGHAGRTNKSGGYSGRDIERIMDAAAAACAEAGISDPKDILKAKLAARAEFKRQQLELSHKESAAAQPKAPRTAEEE